ncbi:MAG: hypothetical protein ABR514_10890 [Chthoniobacterales bacterium]
MSAQPLCALTLSKSEAVRIGKKVWQNECNGTISGLTSWNAGEDFASLGIGHFIWYPEGKRGPFEESFPKLITFISDHDVEVAIWLQPPRPCPWSSRSEFERARSSPQMSELRTFLARTVDLQAQFLVDRLEHALPKMLDETASENRLRVQQRFERVASTAQGCYALVDYVNFKGEGVLHSERYRGQGWGLLQVLEEMRGASKSEDAFQDFAHAAKSVLVRRVKNSPPERKESRWLPGWLKRVNSYIEKL